MDGVLNRNLIHCDMIKLPESRFFFRLGHKEIVNALNCASFSSCKALVNAKTVVIQLEI